jgi:hypothetical protein
MNQEKELCCQKIVFTNGSEKNNVLLGLVTGNDGFYVQFKTLDNEYLILRDKVISISKTKEIFRTLKGEADGRLQ